MSDWATLGGQRIVSGSITIPYYGAWVAEIVLSVSTTIPTTSVPLVFGDLTLTGSVFRQFSFTGSRSATVVGGYGGWQKTVASRAYQNSGGILTATILGDLCADCGESLGAASSSSIAGQTFGSLYMREAGPAVRTLKQIGGPIWWIDNTGATQVVDRATLAASGQTSDTTHLGAITSQFNTISWSGAKGRFEIASETPSHWMPGRTFSDANVTATQTVAMVVHSIEGSGSARTVVLATP